MSERPVDGRDLFAVAAQAKAAARDRLRRALSGDKGGEPDDEPGDEGEREEPRPRPPDAAPHLGRDDLGLALWPLARRLTTRISGAAGGPRAGALSAPERRQRAPPDASWGPSGAARASGVVLAADEPGGMRDSDVLAGR